MSLDDERRVICLYEELRRLHRDAKALPLEDLQRWVLSIRAHEISTELTQLREKVMVLPS